LLGELLHLVEPFPDTFRSLHCPVFTVLGHRFLLP
jgi:hypothetical protein